jgi:hypothetical protein
MNKRAFITSAIVMIILLTYVFSHAASVSVSVSTSGGAVNASVSGSFASCTTCDINNHCTTNNSGSVSLYLENGYLCSAGGTCGASCNAPTLDRGGLNGTHTFYGYASDCEGSTSSSHVLTLDNTPSITTTGPANGSTLSGPFDVMATATFTPTLSETKGSISCAYGPKANPGIWC